MTWWQHSISRSSACVLSVPFLAMMIFLSNIPPPTRGLGALLSFVPNFVVLITMFSSTRSRPDLSPLTSYIDYVLTSSEEIFIQLLYNWRILDLELSSMFRPLTVRLMTGSQTAEMCVSMFSPDNWQLCPGWRNITVTCWCSLRSPASSDQNTLSWLTWLIAISEDDLPANLSLPSEFYLYWEGRNKDPFSAKT